MCPYKKLFVFTNIKNQIFQCSDFELIMIMTYHTRRNTYRESKQLTRFSFQIFTLVSKLWLYLKYLSKQAQFPLHIVHTSENKPRVIHHATPLISCNTTSKPFKAVRYLGARWRTGARPFRGAVRSKRESVQQDINWDRSTVTLLCFIAAIDLIL